MQNFGFSTAQRILFGVGESRRLPEIARSHKIRRILLVTGSNPERVAMLTDTLREARITSRPFSVRTEPTLEIVRKGVAEIKEFGCDGVIAIGGGSVLDAAKAMAVLAGNEGDVLDYLEVIGQGRALTRRGIPLIALPTTAGTGAEVTRNAVLAVPEQRVKASLRGEQMLPVAAIVDAALTLHLPQQTTAFSGMDALTQLIEAYVSVRANPITDGLCLQGLTLVSRSFLRAVQSGSDISARTDMALASLLSGLALANAGLGVVHGFAGPLGGMYNAPHGAICAALLAAGMSANIRHAEREGEHTQDKHPALERYRDVGRTLTGKADAQPQDAVTYIRNLTKELAIPPLRCYGMSTASADTVIDKATQASSMKANAVVLTRDELLSTYQEAL